jgi:hypothetical protein
VPTYTHAKTVPNFRRPREIIADTRCGSATRGRASACAACAACDARAVCADRCPAGQHAGRCVRHRTRITICGGWTYDLAPARVRESTRRADCNADVTTPSTDTLRICVPTKRLTRTTGIDRRRSEHREPGGWGGWRDDATETSGGRIEDVRGQLSRGQKVHGVGMEGRPAAGRRRPCSVHTPGQATRRGEHLDDREAWDRRHAARSWRSPTSARAGADEDNDHQPPLLLQRHLNLCAVGLPTHRARKRPWRGQKRGLRGVPPGRRAKWRCSATQPA